jgi:hypothetical protein
MSITRILDGYKSLARAQREIGAAFEAAFPVGSRARYMRREQPVTVVIWEWAETFPPQVMVKNPATGNIYYLRGEELLADLHSQEPQRESVLSEAPVPAGRIMDRWPA